MAYVRKIGLGALTLEQQAYSIVTKANAATRGRNDQIRQEFLIAQNLVSSGQFAEAISAAERVLSMVESEQGTSPIKAHAAELIEHLVSLSSQITSNDSSAGTIAKKISDARGYFLQGNFEIAARRAEEGINTANGALTRIADAAAKIERQAIEEENTARYLAEQAELKRIADAEQEAKRAASAADAAAYTKRLEDERRERILALAAANKAKADQPAIAAAAAEAERLRIYTEDRQRAEAERITAQQSAIAEHLAMVEADKIAQIEAAAAEFADLERFEIEEQQRLIDEAERLRLKEESAAAERAETAERVRLDQERIADETFAAERAAARQEYATAKKAYQDRIYEHTEAAKRFEAEATRAAARGDDQTAAIMTTRANLQRAAAAAASAALAALQQELEHADYLNRLEHDAALHAGRGNDQTAADYAARADAECADLELAAAERDAAENGYEAIIIQAENFESEVEAMKTVVPRTTPYMQLDPKSLIAQIVNQEIPQTYPFPVSTDSIPSLSLQQSVMSPASGLIEWAKANPVILLIAVGAIFLLMSSGEKKPARRRR